MKTNKETAKAFVNGNYATGSNLCTDGDVATSYRTAIAQKNGNGILIADTYNCMNYESSSYFTGRTNTTEKHKSLIMSEAKKANKAFFVVPDIFADTFEEHEKNYSALVENATKWLHKAEKARTEMNYNRYMNLFNELNKVTEEYVAMYINA